MARTSPLPSFSSSSSALSSSASPPSSSGTRKKKNIGALLSSYYNLENESKGEASDVPFSAAASLARGEGAGAAAVAASGAISTSSGVKQLQQQSRVLSVLSGSDRAAGGAASAPSVGNISGGCTSFNPFSVAEDSSCLVSSGLGDKRKKAFSPSARSPRAAGGGGAVAAAAGIEGCSNSSSQNRRGSSMEVMRRSRGRLGDQTATAVSKQGEHAAAGAALPTTTAVNEPRGGGGKGFAAAAAEGALAAAAEGLGFLLGEGEDSSSSRDVRWTEKGEETGPSSSEDRRRDLDSEHFDVRAFFSAAVENMSLRELLQASSKLDEEVRQCEGELQMLVYENYTKFLEAAETVRGVKEDMHALEGDMTQLAVRAAAIEGSSKELDDLVRDRAASIEELVSFRQLLDKLQILFTLPDVLRWYLTNEDIESVVSLYLRLHPFLEEQETAFPALQRLRLLHTEATTLFEAAKRRLRQQLRVSQPADGGASFSRDVCGRGSSTRTSKALSRRESSSSDRSSTSRKEVLLLDQTASDAGEEEVQFIPAATASRVFHLLLRAGESPRELLELFMRNRIHVLQLLLLRVVNPHVLLLAAQPTSPDFEKPAQQQHPGAQQQLEQSQPQQQQQQNFQSVCPEDGSASSQRVYMRGEGATATPPRSSAATATEEYTAATTDASSAAAEQMLQVACRHLSQLFMEPFVTALQDILSLRPSSGDSPATSGQASGDRLARPVAAVLPSAAVDIGKREENAASSFGLDSPAPSPAAVTTDPFPAAVTGRRAASDSLSIVELNEKICTFLMPLLLRVLEGFLRLIARLRPAAAAVVETMRKLRAVLLQPLHRLVLPELLQKQITECFHNFTYQVLSVCVAEAFRSAYLQAAQELAAIQRFCFSGAASAAAAGAAALSSKPPAGAAPATAHTAQTNSQYANLMQVDTVCFFLNEKQQEEAQQLLSQKEHALLLRGCLAVTDVHKLIDGVCGVRSSLAEKLVLQELGTWTEGYFSVFVAALLRLVRDTPAALQASPLLRAEAEFLRGKEIAGRSSSSSSCGANCRDEKSSASWRQSHDTQSDGRRDRTDFRNAFFIEKEEEERKEKGKKKRCYSCCCCWRLDAEATAGNEASAFTERKRDDLMYVTADIALLEKTLVSRCISVEEEVTEAVSAAVVTHLATTSSANEHLPSTREREDTESCEEKTSVEHSRASTLRRESSDIYRPQQRSRSRTSQDASEADVLHTDVSAEARHAESSHTDVLAKPEMSSGTEREENSDALMKRTDLSYAGKTAVCCVLLMRLGRSLELHGVSKINAVAAELFPSFPVNSFTSTAAVPGVLETAAGDSSAPTAAVASPHVGEQGTARAAVYDSTAAGATTGAACVSGLPEEQHQHTVVKEPPLVRLRRVLQAALVTYVYLRGCQGASLGTAALLQMLVHKRPLKGLPALPLAAAAAPCTARGSTAGASPTPADAVAGVVEDIKTPAAVGDGEDEYDRASEWLRLKDREAQERFAIQRAEDVGERTSPAVNIAPTEGQLDLPAEAAGTTSQREAPDASTHSSPAVSHSSNTTSTAESSGFLSTRRDVPFGSHSHTADSTVRRASDSSNAAPAGACNENATASPGEDTLDSAGADVGDAVSVADGGGVQGVPVGVIGLMDTLLLLLHHCDEETFVFLGEQRLAGSGILLLRKGSGGGGVSGALLPGSARLPRRLQAAAAAGDAAAATVEQRQQQHVRRLARLFGRRRTAIEKEMERLFARKQPVFSRVSLNRHKALMAIFKVACRPFLEAVRDTLFTRLEVRQMQVECAAAAENLRDLVASEDGCVVDGLLDELVASSLRRCLHAAQLSESIDDTWIGYCAGAGGTDTRTSAGSRRILGRLTTDGGRSLPAAALPRWSSSAADSSVGAAYTRMAEGRRKGTGEKERSDVLLEPALVEEICNRSSDRYHLLLTNSKGMT